MKPETERRETEMKIKEIGHIQTDFPEKFGVPRQSGLVEGLVGRIVFQPEYRMKEAFRGLEGFSHIWIIWEFSEVEEGSSWHPTVRPPVLGGNKRMGVFATRSPFRPNRIGLSSVKLERVDYDAEDGPVLYVSGIDMVDGTPVLDIKPYIAYADSHPDAEDGFLGQASRKKLKVIFPEETDNKKLQVLKEVLEQGPLPAYANDPERIYGMSFAGMDVKFSVDGDVLTVRTITDQEPECDTSS